MPAAGGGGEAAHKHLICPCGTRDRRSARAGGAAHPTRRSPTAQARTSRPARGAARPRGHCPPPAGAAGENEQVRGSGRRWRLGEWGGGEEAVKEGTRTGRRGGRGSEEPGGGEEDPKARRRRRRHGGAAGAQGARTGRNWRGGGGGGGAGTQGPCPPSRPYLVQGQLQLGGAGRETAAASTSQPRLRLSPATAAAPAPCAGRGRAARRGRGGSGSPQLQHLLPPLPLPLRLTPRRGSRHRRRLQRPFGPAPAQRANQTPRYPRASPPGRPRSRPLAQVWERPNPYPPASRRPVPAGLSAPRCT